MRSALPVLKKIGIVLVISFTAFQLKANTSFDDLNRELEVIENKIDVIDAEVGSLLECCTDSASTLTFIESQLELIDLAIDDCCTGIPVQNSDQVSGAITLSTSNNYIFIEDIIYPIVITVDDLCLNLNCRKISSSTGSANLITVNSNLSRVAIYGGDIVNTDSPTGSGSGILINDGCSNIRLKNVSVSGCGNGIKLAGTDGNEVTASLLVNCDFTSNTTGLSLERSDENTIKHCSAIHSTKAGFTLEHSESNCFYDCQALKTSGSQSTMGFVSDSGRTNLLQRCVAKKTQTTAENFCNKVHGFLLTGTEERTKLIECVVNDTDMTSTVSAVAYGIQLAPVLLDDADLLVEVDSDNTAGTTIYTVAWSADGKHIASGDHGKYVRVYGFDNNTINHIANSASLEGSIQSVDWSPDDRYIASGDITNYVHILNFDGSQVELIVTSSFALAGEINSVFWSPDGKYLASASGDDEGDDGFIYVFSFDGLSLSFISRVGVTDSYNFNAVAWSPDGKYLTCGDGANYVRVFSFDGATLTYINGNNDSSSEVVSVAWSPDGKHIASCDGTELSGYVRVFSFDGSSVIEIDSDNTPGSWVDSVAWSPDGKYIVSGDEDDYIRVFNFDGTQLTQIKAITIPPNEDVYSVAWSSDGLYIVSGDYDGYVRIFTAMNAPQNCTIKKCTVCDTNAYGKFVGTGIAGGGNNTFLQNACCNNEVNFTYGVPNVFYGEHNLQRNDVHPFDNISMPTTHANVVNLNQLLACCTDNARLLESVESKIDIPLETEYCCTGVTLLKNSDAVGGVITLPSAGNYKVAEDLTASIVIPYSRTCLDLDCYQISSTTGSTNLITVNSNLSRVSMYGGYLRNTASPTGSGAGVLVNNGCSNIRIENLSITGCGNGIKLDGSYGNEVTAGFIQSCDFTSNTTGLVLEYADKNIIKDCSAVQNTQAGFELIHSEANCFYDCQAIKTSGSQSTMGFVSDSGSSNLFQRCAAKETQTSGEDFYTKVCGFLLTGTESKTKIIDCVVNDTDMTSTVSAVSYGIQLVPILLDDADLLVEVASDDTEGASIFSVAWSPDRRYIASGGDSDLVRVFRFDSLQLDYINSSTFTLGGDVYSVAWSPDGKYIASGDNGGLVRIFNFDGSSLNQVATGNVPEKSRINSVAWSPDGKYIAIGDNDNYVHVFSFDGAQIDQVATSADLGNYIYSVAWSPDGRYIASGDASSYIRVLSFNGSSLSQIDAYDMLANDIRSVAWSPNGKYIASGDSGNYLRVFSFDGSTISLVDSETSPPGNTVFTVAWSPDGKYIASGDSDSYIRIFSFNGSQIIHIKNTSPIGDPYSVAWSSDGIYITSGDSVNYVRVFDAMYGPENCLIDNCKVCDTSAYGEFVGTGIAGGGNSSFLKNACCNNEVNFSYGVPNVFYGNHNIQRNTIKPFDNTSKPTTQ